jgi:hypothetical protein
MQLDSTCDHCGADYTHRYTYRESRFCSRRCSAAATAVSRPLADRFWEKVDTSGWCWLWTGSRNRRGYGKVSRWPRGMDYAHRVSYELNVGPIPAGMDVRHLVCDNPPCVRPSHLEIGPHRVNMGDAVRKGRIRSGIRHHNAKLTNEQVGEIRRRYQTGVTTQASLAIEFGISRAYVSEIVTGAKRQPTTPLR